ncbi:hypothetical protein QJQ45_017979 [Haematococcus lacustris]|nr:hypothetical protein QJQ45_017979 [Haematococcus lacustris]
MWEEDTPKTAGVLHATGHRISLLPGKQRRISLTLIVSIALLQLTHCCSVNISHLAVHDADSCTHRIDSMTTTLYMQEIHTHSLNHTPTILPTLTWHLPPINCLPAGGTTRMIAKVGTNVVRLNTATGRRLNGAASNTPTSSAYVSSRRTADGRIALLGVPALTGYEGEQPVAISLMGQVTATQPGGPLCALPHLHHASSLVERIREWVATHTGVTDIRVSEVQKGQFRIGPPGNGYTCNTTHYTIQDLPPTHIHKILQAHERSPIIADVGTDRGVEEGRMLCSLLEDTPNSPYPVRARVQFRIMGGADSSDMQIPYMGASNRVYGTFIKRLLGSAAAGVTISTLGPPPQTQAELAAQAQSLAALPIKKLLLALSATAVAPITNSAEDAYVIHSSTPHLKELLDQYHSLAFELSNILSLSITSLQQPAFHTTSIAVGKRTGDPITAAEKLLVMQELAKAHQRPDCLRPLISANNRVSQDWRTTLGLRPVRNLRFANMQGDLLTPSGDGVGRDLQLVHRDPLTTQVRITYPLDTTSPHTHPQHGPYPSHTNTHTNTPTHRRHPDKFKACPDWYHTYHTQAISATDAIPQVDTVDLTGERAAAAAATAFAPMEGDTHCLLMTGSKQDMVGALSAAMTLGGVIETRGAQLQLGIHRSLVGAGQHAVVWFDEIDSPEDPDTPHMPAVTMANHALTGLQHIVDLPIFMLRAAAAAGEDTSMLLVPDANATLSLQTRATTHIVDARVAVETQVAYVPQVVKASTHLGNSRPQARQGPTRGWNRLQGNTSSLQPLPPPPTRSATPPARSATPPDRAGAGTAPQGRGGQPPRGGGATRGRSGGRGRGQPPQPHTARGPSTSAWAATGGGSRTGSGGSLADFDGLAIEAGMYMPTQVCPPHQPTDNTRPSLACCLNTNTHARQLATSTHRGPPKDQDTTTTHIFCASLCRTWRWNQQPGLAERRGLQWWKPQLYQQVLIPPAIRPTTPGSHADTPCKQDTNTEPHSMLEIPMPLMLEIPIQDDTIHCNHMTITMRAGAPTLAMGDTTTQADDRVQTLQTVGRSQVGTTWPPHTRQLSLSLLHTGPHTWDCHACRDILLSSPQARRDRRAASAGVPSAREGGCTFHSLLGSALQRWRSKPKRHPPHNHGARRTHAGGSPMEETPIETPIETPFDGIMEASHTQPKDPDGLTAAQQQHHQAEWDHDQENNA